MILTVDDGRRHLLAKPAVTEEPPFGPDVLVYKVPGKMFATLAFDDDEGRMNLKCDRALGLRDEHEAIIPGDHMNKQNWNTLELDSSLPPSLVAELIDLPTTSSSRASPPSFGILSRSREPEIYLPGLANAMDVRRV